MLNALIHAAKQKFTVDPVDFPNLPEDMMGMPRLSEEPCAGEACSRCIELCPTGAIVFGNDGIEIDLGCCLACGACINACPTKTIQAERTTMTATKNREDLVITARKPLPKEDLGKLTGKSIDVRVVSTGCSATDLEVNASLNPDFDGSRYGIRVVASPRFADILLVTGPVPQAMQEPLVRCYDAMPDPRLVVAAGCSAISGGLHRGTYANGAGVEPHLKPDAFIPGNPPHPISVTYGILLAARQRPSGQAK